MCIFFYSFHGVSFSSLSTEIIINPSAKVCKSVQNICVTFITLNLLDTMISQCDVKTTKTYCTICITITYSVVNIESEFKYENQGLMEKNSYFVQHITIACHT